jgi:hypothetical protein
MIPDPRPKCRDCRTPSTFTVEGVSLCFVHARVAALDVLLARGEAIQIENPHGETVRNRWICKACGHKHTRNGKPADYVSPYPCAKCNGREFEVIHPIVQLPPPKRVWTWQGPFPATRRLSDCGLSTRSANCLLNTTLSLASRQWDDDSAGIGTVADLLAFRRFHAGVYQTSLLRIPNFGRLCLAETLSLLAAIDACSSIDGGDDEGS